MINALKLERRNRISHASHRGMQAAKRGLALMLALSFLLNVTFDALSAAENVKREQFSKGIRIKPDSKLETALPFKFGKYRIGNPASKNNFPGVYSAIEPNSPQGDHKGKDFYTIGCLIKNEVDIPVYMEWNDGPKCPFENVARGRIGVVSRPHEADVDQRAS